MTHYSPNAPVNWTPLSKLIEDSSPMISSAIIAFSLCSHESRSQHLCEYLVGDCACLMFSPCRGVPRTVSLDHFHMSRTTACCIALNVQDHGVLGTVVLSVRSTFL